jgi:hypothetical protein
MPEMLGGDLARVSLPDVLELLVAGGQTGRLDLSDGVNTGEIYLQDGSLVHAVSGSQMAEEAVYSLMAWQRGDFKFVVDAAAPEMSILMPADELLEKGTKQATEWASIRQAIPGPDTVLGLSPSGSPGGVSLDPEEWQVLAQVDGVRDVSEIADALALDEFTASKVLARLVSTGLLEPKATPGMAAGPTLNGDFFTRLDEEFVDVVGPLGPVIIDDEVADMGETRESFPRDKVAELVERISADIEGQGKRARFQEIMLDLLRGP